MDALITFLIKFSLFATPVLLIVLVTFAIIFFFKKKEPKIESISNMKIDTIEGITGFREEKTKVLSIDPDDWENEEPTQLTEAGSRVYRTYRSIDRRIWTECDLSLTERAACNYADYIKKNNPQEFVRCEDPNGLILFYE
jgi:hypothetical protein